MTQKTGINALVFMDQFNISSDGNRVTINRSAEAPEKTAFQPPGKTRQRAGSGLLDWTMSMDGFFNDVSPCGVDELFGNKLGAGSAFGVYLESGASQTGYEGTPRETSYNLEAPVDNMVTISTEMSASGPILRATIIRLGSFDSSGGSAVSNSIDLGGDSAKLRGFARIYNEANLGAGSGIKLTLQHSGDDTAFSDLGAFATTFTGSGFEQKQFTSASQYVRVATCPQGTDPTANVFVAVASED